MCEMYAHRHQFATTIHSIPACNMGTSLTQPSASDPYIHEQDIHTKHCFLPNQLILQTQDKLPVGFIPIVIAIILIVQISPQSDNISTKSGEPGSNKLVASRTYNLVYHS